MYWESIKIILIFVSNVLVIVLSDGSSLAFVFDTTGSMYNDLAQLRSGAEMILRTALEESDVIADFVIVPFNDPSVGPATVTGDKEVFHSTLRKLRVYGGGDCPEKSLGGIMMALTVCRPHSYLYVFTDATAGDHRMVNVVLDMVQRKQSQVVFILTGHCNDFDEPSYQVYKQISAASSGQIFNLNKTSVHKVLDFVRSSVKGRKVNLGSVTKSAGQKSTQKFPVDDTLGEVTVSVSGAKPKVKVVNPSGVEIKGPPQLVVTLDLSEIMVVKVIQPEVGSWSITAGSAEPYTVKVVGLSNLTFEHGFSVLKPKNMTETTYRPLKGEYNYMMIKLSHIDRPVTLSRAEIVNLEGRTLFEIDLKEVDGDNEVYLTDEFIPPEEFFYVAINGYDEFHHQLRRIGATAIQPKLPDAPIVTSPHKIEAHKHARLVLSCKVDSLVQVSATWKNNYKLLSMFSNRQSFQLDYTIENVTKESAGEYECIATSAVGRSTSLTQVVVKVDPPQVTATPRNATLIEGESVTITCAVRSEEPLNRSQLLFKGSTEQFSANFEPVLVDDLYVYEKTFNTSLVDNGLYTCIAANRGGISNESIHITVQKRPTAKILNTKPLTIQLNTDVQLKCSIDNADTIQWIAPNRSVVYEDLVRRHNFVLNLRNITEDGVWTCVAIVGSHKESDDIQLNVVVNPKVAILGDHNVTAYYASQYTIVCRVEAKPRPAVTWWRGNEQLNVCEPVNITPNVYECYKTINVTLLDDKQTYRCIASNSLSTKEDILTVNVRKNMTVLRKPSDAAVQLYEKAEFHCLIDSYPEPHIEWQHNNTEIINYHDTSIVIDRVDFDNLGVYVCVARNTYEFIELKGSLTVYGLEVPDILKEYEKVVIKRDQETKVSCRILKGNPKPTLKWQYRNSSATNFTTLQQYTNITVLYIENTQIKHAGTYRCSAENVVGEDHYDFELVLHFAPQLLSIPESTSPMQLKSGDEIVLSCNASGSPRPLVVWTKDGRPLIYNSHINVLDYELKIKNLSIHDSGVYACNATNSVGTVGRNFTLFVYMTPNITLPGIESQLDVVEGQLVELPCPVQGFPPPSVFWIQNGQIINDSRKYVSYEEQVLRFVANVTDFGNYSCVTTNIYGTAVYNYSVQVWVPSYIDPPLVTKLDVLRGSNVSITCNAFGFPIPSISWAINGSLAADNTTNISFNDLGSLYIYNVSEISEGAYTCIADNMVGVANKLYYLNVNEPPKIVKDEFNGTYIATDMDTELVIPCKATGKPKPYVIWSKDGFYLDNDYRYAIDSEGTLTINSPKEEVSGVYRCDAKNSAGFDNAIVFVEVYSMPKEIQGDEAIKVVSVLEGANTSIECPVTSRGGVVKWYKDAQLISEGTLKIQNISRENASEYACVLTNAVGSASSSVTLNVEWPPRFLSEDSQLVDSTQKIDIVMGEDLYLNCTFDANPIAKIQWTHSSNQILNRDSKILKVNNIQTHQKGIYKCTATNIHGIISKTFLLNVLEPPFISELDLIDVSMKENLNATLECNARGVPKPTITWTYNNTNWHTQNSTIITTNITSSSEGLFLCTATNKVGSAHLTYRVTVVTAAKVMDIIHFVHGRGINVPVSNNCVKAELGTHIRISCAAAGKPIPSVQWITHGNIISENIQDSYYADLKIDGVETKHSGVYSCFASNEGGMEERQITLNVLEPPKIFQTLFQNINSSQDSISIEVITGQAFYLHCHAYGNPVPSIYWFKDGMPLKLFDDAMVFKDFSEVLVSKKAVYEQSGNYTCVARNEVGSTSVVYIVYVLVPPPTPKENLIPITARYGKQLTLSCPIEGYPTPYVKWIKHPYIELSSQQRIQLSDDDVTLIINNAEVSDTGKYSCIMTNKVGSTEYVYDVTIEKPPSISGVNDTEDIVVSLMKSTLLKCEVDGYPPPKIRWLKDTQKVSPSVNVHLVLGNSLLALWDAAGGHEGQYLCIAENAAGTATRKFNVRLQVPGKWSSWSQWTHCNVTCGLGYQHRNRVCQYIDDHITIDKTSKLDKIILDESECKGYERERRKCHMPACEDENGPAHWSGWSAWSACSASCGAGAQTRTRACRGTPGTTGTPSTTGTFGTKGTPTACRGDNVQIRKCTDLPPCPSRNDMSNAVYHNSTLERDIESNPYSPIATFEINPEVTNSDLPETEAYVMKTVAEYPEAFFEVNVTSNLDGSDWSPHCSPGFRYNDATQLCDDIDECKISSNECHATQVCANTQGGYRCGCPRGYYALGAGRRCLDINECSLGVSGCEFACVNAAGGYVCACPAPLRLHADNHHCVTPSMYKAPLRWHGDNESYLTDS